MENIRRFYKSNLIKVLTGVRRCGKSVLLNQIKDNNKYYIFLDEIKHIKQFKKVLASLKATQNVFIFVTRSISKLLSGRLASLLACNDSNKVFVAHFIENLVYNELLYRGYDFKIGKTYKGEIDFVTMKDGKECFIQVAYLLSSYDEIERGFGAFDGVRDPSPKYVFSLDE